MPRGPLGGPRPITTSTVSIQIAVIDDRAAPNEIEMENIANDILNTQTEVTVNESFEHEGQDIFIETFDSELSVGLVEELRDVIEVRVRPEIRNRHITFKPTRPTGPIGAPRPFAETTVRVRTRFGIDGEFPPQDIQISTLEVLRNNIIFQSALGTDIGADFIHPTPPHIPLIDKAQYMLDLIVDTGTQEATLEEVQEIIIRTEDEIEDLGFLIADRFSSVVV